MRGRLTGGAVGVVRQADPLPVRQERGAVAGAELGEESAVGAREGGFRWVNGWGLGGEDSIRGGGVKGGLNCCSVKVGEGKFKIGGRHDAICEEWRDRGEETRLEGRPDGAGAGWSSHYGK